MNSIKYLNCQWLNPVLVLFVLNSSLIAQTNIKGKTNELATIQVVELKKGTQANQTGDYYLEIPKAGSFTVLITAVGFKAHREKFTIKKGETKIINVLLESLTNELKEVEVTAKSNAQLQREEPIKVEVLEIAKIAERAISLPQIINQTAGVKIREASGVGSNFEVNINGLQGNAIRFFKNGIVTDYLGRANQLNLIPSGLISNIEIYKGVLPIELGADALGGGINITTTTPNKSFLNTSYEVGSFNTHIGTVNANFVIPKTKLHLGLSSYAIHSDNDYHFDAPVRDFATQQLTYRKLPRFHDVTSSQYVQGNFGLHDTRFADYINFEIGYFNYDKELQNGILIDDVFGEATSTEQSKIYSFTYEKNFAEKLNIKAFAAKSDRTEWFKDLSDYNYDWTGEKTNPTQPNKVGGEISSPKTDQTVNHDITTGRLFLSYELSKQLSLKASSMFSDQGRVGSDPYATRNPVTGIQPITIPNNYNKIISGISANFKLFKDKLNNELAIKHFSLKAGGHDAWYGDETSQNHQSFGYSNSIKYALDKFHFVRASFEKTTRIPEAFEYFGDNIFLLANPSLEPETSQNINLGFAGSLNKLRTLSADVNLFFRNTENFIRVVPLGFITARHENTNAQLTRGLEGSLKYKNRKNLMIGIAITYQDMRRRKSGNALEDSKTPNVPYFFTNLNASKEFKGIFGKSLDLEVYGNYYFTEQYLLYPINKNLEPGLFERNLSYTDLIIPAQNQLDAGLTFKLQNIPININVQINNITNAELYDQFRVQKPLRNFRIKLTYKL
jgi:outer membrane receptor protein involved in Fe transport